MDTKKALQIMAEMKIFAKENEIPIIQDDSLELLLQAVKENKPKNILEIGTAIGYSSLAILSVLDFKGNIFSIEKDVLRLNQAKLFWSKMADCVSKIHFVQGDAGSYLLQGLPCNFDFLFLDANKGHYLTQLKLVEPYLNDGAIVFADNVLFRGLVKKEMADCPRRLRTIVKRMKAFLFYMQNSNYFETKVYLKGDGVLIAKFCSH